MDKKPVSLAKVFGSNVYSDRVMKDRLPKKTYDELKKTIDDGKQLTLEVAKVVAEDMKNWALDRGATHYTHWFQPLTDITAEKHDAFITPTKDGGAELVFSGKMLIKGEPDASSFPSGGLRATFEARGYTVWDSSSPAFLKEDADGDVTLCIPTAFYSYTGVALDKKIPVLRSMEAVSKQALRILRAMGNKKSKRVFATLGPEQEYFLIDKELYLKRLDLMLCGRTLFGSASPKGQELEDQYFGSIKDRIAGFMTDLDMELWKLGITSKTRHNEVAPAQFEMAPMFENLNLAVDHNQLAMDTMQKVALRHGLVCLLHEKPYSGINGSGKHNNWSLATDDGLNLLEPGDTPHDNAQFLIFLAALINAVDKHADLLRAGAATPGNDHRLGANEAPPAIISMFLGDQITETIEAIAAGKKVKGYTNAPIKIGVDSLPLFPKDNSDRNRTSPFAFTGNKFEFRMVGSSASNSNPNMVLNTIVAETLDEFATRLEKAKNVNAEVLTILKEVVKAHSKVIFNGNNYAEDWVKEAEKRGLPNVKNMVDAHRVFVGKKAETLFTKYGVLSKEELHSRYDVALENYIKVVNIEALTALKMAKTMYIPAMIKFTAQLAGTINKVKTAGGSSSTQAALLKEITSLLDSITGKVKKLDNAIEDQGSMDETTKKAKFVRDEIFTGCVELRSDVDTAEKIMPAELWPVPTYADMLFKM